MLSPDCELASNKLILTTEVNSEYIDNGIFANWYQSAQPFFHSSIQLLFDVPDAGAIDRLKTLKYLPDDVLIMNDKMEIVPLFESSGSGTSMLKSPYGSEEYLALMTRRPTRMKHLLEMKCSVLHVDIDTWWIKSPFDDIANTNHDLLITDNSPANNERDVCGCFLFMKPASPVLKLTEDWIERINDPKYTGKGNQPALNFAINGNKDNIDYAFLSYKHFPPGKAVMLGLHDVSQVVLYHANFLRDSETKIAFLSERGMWHPERADRLPQQ